MDERVEPVADGLDSAMQILSVDDDDLASQATADDDERGDAGDGDADDGQRKSRKSAERAEREDKRAARRARARARNALANRGEPPLRNRRSSMRLRRCDSTGGGGFAADSSSTPSSRNSSSRPGASGSEAARRIGENEGELRMCFSAMLSYEAM